MGETRRRGKSKNMYKGYVGMDNEVGIDCGRRGGVGRTGESNREKCGITN